MGFINLIGWYWKVETTSNGSWEAKLSYQTPRYSEKVDEWGIWRVIREALLLTNYRNQHFTFFESCCWSRQSFGRMILAKQRSSSCTNHARNNLTQNFYLQGELGHEWDCYHKWYKIKYKNLLHKKFLYRIIDRGRWF